MNKFSVIMPVYGVEKYVGTAIASVLSQTYTDFEFLIINDCSPDKSVDICREFKDERIRIIEHNENRGLAGARNTGIRHANGEYLAFLDSDDAWTPDKLKQHLAHLQSNEEIGISFSRSAFIDEDGVRLSTCQMPRLDHAPAAHLLCRNPIGNGSAPVVRREVFKEIEFEADNGHADTTCYFDESLRQSEDIECWIRIRLKTNWKIEGISEALTLYRLNAGGLSANIPKQLGTWERVIDKTKAYAPELIEEHGQQARAYQLRYLARQAIRLGDGKIATDMFHQSMACDWRIILREPSRTVMTGVAAYLQKILPSQWFESMMPVAISVTGFVQKIRIRFYEMFNTDRKQSDNAGQLDDAETVESMR